MGNVVSDAPSSSSSKIMIYWASPNYWTYFDVVLNNSRDPELSKYDDLSFGDLMAETVPRQTVQNVLKRLGNKPITLEHVLPILKRSLLPQDMVLFLQDIIRKRDEGNNGISREEKIELIY